MRPRRELVDVSACSTYHCTSRCVRRAYLLDERTGTLRCRRAWIESRLAELAAIFAIAIETFAILENHLHLLLTLLPELVAGWSDREVARRWLLLHPPRVARGVRRAATEEDVDALAGDAKKIRKCRRRLLDLGEFHKALKEPIARIANREDGVTGHFWEGRYRSKRVLDPAALLATMAYVDLNPVRAGTAETPEESRFTGIRCRIAARKRAQADRSRRGGRKARRSIGAGGTSATLEPTPSFLTPIQATTARRGLFEGLTLEDYLAFVDRVGRMIRHGRRGRIPMRLRPILERLDLDGSSLIEQLAATGRWFGSVIGQAESVVQEAVRCGRSRLVSAMQLDGS